MNIKSISGLCLIILLGGIFLLTSTSFAQDENFYIYLCFGQSNMEGQGDIEPQDETVDSRFMVMEATDCSNLGREKGEWYTAVPPLCRCYTGLCPVDYFGRTMVENLPDSITVGVINVSVAGCKIELFDKDTYEEYAAGVESWMQSIIAEYDGNPYQYLVDLADSAQKAGVIKGILLHQGESNTGDSQWPAKVKKIYDDMLSDLGLEENSIPLFAGEVVNADQGGVCASMNAVIATLPNTLTNSYVISSSGCTDQSDNLHFNSAGYRKLGTRYAIKALALMGIEVEDPDEPEVPDSTGTLSVYFEPECETVGGNWVTMADEDASNGAYVTSKTGFQNLEAGPESSSDYIEIPFSVDSADTYYIYARLNCPTYDDDSFWLKMDDGEYIYVNGLSTSGVWSWTTLNNYDLTEGAHTLTIGYREDGALLDKICVSNYTAVPTGMGEEAENVCTPTDADEPEELTNEYALEQNYPNPFNPATSIKYRVASAGNVTLKLYNMLGQEVMTLVNEMKSPGSYEVRVDASGLSSGVYFYKLTSGSYISVRKMVLMK